MYEDKKQKFKLITNELSYEDDYRKDRLRAYQTNPLKMHGESLKEEFMRFTNGEGGRRFTVEDLLRGC